MKTKDVIKILKSHRGPVYVALQLRNTTLYVQAVRSDLVAQLMELDSDGEVEVRKKGFGLFVDSAID